MLPKVVAQLDYTARKPTKKQIVGNWTRRVFQDPACVPFSFLALPDLVTKESVPPTSDSTPLFAPL
jgi:hypothetical protein